MDDKSKVTDQVNITDSLEAIGSFKAMKNLFFVVLFIAMLATQTIFWLNYLGYIDDPKTSSQSVETKGEAKQEIEVSIEDQANKVVADVKSEKPADPNAVPAKITEDTPEDVSAVNAFSENVSRYMPAKDKIISVVRFCNFVLIFTATIYCLILLMSLKISLVGSLGGVSHISMAFFYSLFALIVLLPWQGLFEGIVVGAIYLPEEIFSKWVLTDESSLLGKIMYFARFSGMWFLSMILMISAQSRSARWSKTTLRRLGIIR